MFEVVEQRRIVRDVFIGVAALRLVVDLPRPLPVAPEPIIAVVGHLRAQPLAIAQDGHEAHAIQVPAGRQRGSADLRAGRQDIKGTSELRAEAAGVDDAGPPCEGRLSNPALPRATLPASQQPRGATALVHNEPRAIVAREEHEGILGETTLPKGVEDHPHAPVQFLDHVAVESPQAGPIEAPGCE